MKYLKIIGAARNPNRRHAIDQIGARRDKNCSKFLEILPNSVVTRDRSRWVFSFGTGHCGTSFSCVVPRVPIGYRNRPSFTQRGLFNI